MIFCGYGCAFICMMPIGRECASGLSLLLSALRVATRSAAHGRYGALWSGMLAPMFANTKPEGSKAGGGVAAVAAGSTPATVALCPARGAQPEHGTTSHTPDRSGLPSDALGAGASNFGLPSAVFGTPAVGYRRPLRERRRGHHRQREGNDEPTGHRSVRTSEHVFHVAHSSLNRYFVLPTTNSKDMPNTSPVTESCPATPRLCSR